MPVKRLKLVNSKEGAESEKYIQQGLIKKLRANGKMSASEVVAAKKQGSVAAAAKEERRRAMRENLPLKPKSQIASQIAKAKGPELKDMMRASVREGQGGSAWMKGTRGRTGDPDTTTMRAIAKLRWGLPLDSKELKAIGGSIAKSNDDRSNKAILDDIQNRFKPSSGGLSQQEINTILSAAS